MASIQFVWDCKRVLNEEQHGVLQGRSTATNLLLYEHFILGAIKEGYLVDSVYTDFSKAFDRVNHGILLTKLEHLGFSKIWLKWLHSFLNDRVQIVKYGDSVSSEFRVPSGVPQGSHCGPILFNLFFIDLSQVIGHNRMLMFADDVKIFGRMKTVNNCPLLQQDIDRFFAWCEDNSMDVNVSKCNQISFFRSLNPLIF